MLRPPRNMVQEGLDLLLDQFKNKPRIEGWLKSYLRQTQLLVDAAYDVLVKRWIDNATGAQLDAIGRLVGEGRKGREDELYRLFIRARIRINRSAGKVTDVLEVLAIISPGTSVRYHESYPAGIVIVYLEAPEYDTQILFEMLRDTKAGGVRLNVVAPTGDPSKLFLYDDVDAPLNEPDHGYGDIDDPQDFGLLSDVLSSA